MVVIASNIICAMKKIIIALLSLFMFSNMAIAQCTECPAGAILITGSSNINEQNIPQDYCISGTWTGHITNIADNSSITICPSSNWDMPNSFTLQKNVDFINYGSISDNSNGYNLKIQGQASISNKPGASINVLGFENQDANFVNEGDITAENIYLHGISSNTGTMTSTASCGGNATSNCGFYLGNKSQPFNNSGTINTVDATLRDGIIGSGIFNSTGTLKIENNSNETENQFFANTVVFQASANINLGSFEISGVLSCNNANVTADVCFTPTGSFGSSCSNSSDPIVQCSALLPVHFVDFTVKEIEGTIVFNWEVESEINVEKYVLHYSLDGLHFEEFASINANNDTYYQLENNSLANNKNLYFKIQNVDIDGENNYFDQIIFLERKIENAYQLSPNPAPKGEAFVIKFSNREDALISIFNINGQKLASRFFKDQDYIKFDLASIENSGLYIVKISTTYSNYTEEIFIE